MAISSKRGSSRLRTSLCTSAAFVSMVIVGTAHAQSGPTGSILEAQGNTPGAPTSSILEPQDGTAPVGSILEPQVVVVTPNTPTTARDATDITGIGQMVIDQQNGFIGLCTGTLINPRTVILAAHCVNETPDGSGFQNPWGYGSGTGGIPIAFGFRANNNAAGNSAFGQYLNGALKWKTNVANYLYNANQVAYNPGSTSLGLANNFLQGDVAIATLDTPAANVPTWAILLSQLPAPGSINATTGTGYHVTIAGYGNNGTGTTGGTGGIDYRRRLAENYLGLLGSLNDLDSFLFGVPDGLPQNLFQLDLDDPRRGTVNASVYDFNVFKDKALPNEGITAPGDSGGPLILDQTYSTKLVIGVLSGGDRFYGAQPSSSYGTSSFYQPLYLFWDWIAANNNYHYVGTKAGDGSWTDPTHWVTNIDPNYMTIVGGNLVNGIPTSLGDGINGTSGKFGAICFDSPTSSDCYDVKTGIETYTVGGNTQTFTFAPAGGTAGTVAIPAATLANGLPGATNFVPNNSDPNPTAHVSGKYFDVTLGAAGTTTLSGSAVTIDRLSLIGSAAKLTIASGASLTSLIDVTQTSGLMTVNGTLTSRGDYLLLNGGLQGTGTINAPFLTSVTGMIAPGTAGTTGTLTVAGNLVLASGNVYLLDVGANGVSDKIAVTATTFTGLGAPTNGLANVGGAVVITPVAGYTIRSGDTYQILTSQGGRTGTFSAPALSAILTPSFIYTANDVKVQIVASAYAGVVSSSSPVQVAYAQLLDQNRATNYGAVADVYGVLDLQNQATIRATLDGLAPRTETLKTALGSVAVDNMARFYANRLSVMGSNTGGGTVAVIGQPLSVVSSMNNVGPMGSVGIDATGAPSTQTVSTGKVPDDISVYFAGGYLNGDSAPMPTAIPLGGRDQFDGYYFAAGVEKWIGGDSAIGFGVSYTDLKGTTVNGQQAKGKLYQGTLYGKLDLGNGLAIDSQISAGLLDVTTFRAVSVAGTPYSITGNDRSLAFNSEVGIRKNFVAGSFTIAPRAAFRGGFIGYSTYVETGGGPALRVDRRGLSSAQARAGVELSGEGKIKPFLSGYYVHDFADAPASFGANFAAGVGPNAQFALAGRDKDWGEVAGGIAINTGKVELSVSADTTIGRTDVSNQSYRGTIKFHF